MDIFHSKLQQSPANEMCPANYHVKRPKKQKKEKQPVTQMYGYPEI